METYILMFSKCSKLVIKAWFAAFLNVKQYYILECSKCL